MRSLLVLLALLLPAFAGCLGGDAPAAEQQLQPGAGADAPAEPGSRDRAPPTADAAGEPEGNATPQDAAAPAPGLTAAGEPFEPHAVIAFIDTGINPYHAAFRDDSPRAYRHPSTYLPGYPADAEAIHLTFGLQDVEASLKADCAEWSKVRGGQLYWFPGTRVVGGINLAQSVDPITCDSPERTSTSVFGTGSHGTMVASRGAGAGYGACPSCLIVAVQGFTPASVTWAADQPWIDLQSNSWGRFLPVPAPADTAFTPSPGFARAVEEAAARQPSFWASGNGALTRFGLAGHPTQVQPHMTPSAIPVGGHDSGRVALWPGWGPRVVSDACASWAAEHETLDESTPRTGGGTSGATPFVAGVVGQVLLDARRILGEGDVGVRDGVLATGPAGLLPEGPLADGVLTSEELLAAVFATADPRPDRTEEDGEVCEPSDPEELLLYTALPVEWSQVPEGGAGIPFLGYGAVTRETGAQALLVLQGLAPMPERPEEDAWFERDAQLRRLAYEAYQAIG